MSTDTQLTLIERLQDEADQCRADGAGDIAALLDEAWRALQSQEFGAWVPAAERMPPSGAVVLVAYRNDRGEWRRIRAQWIAAKSVESSCDSEIGEYDDATDTYYDPEGWYERINNWDDYSAVVVHEGKPSHWMPLPAPPESANGGIQPPPPAVGCDAGLCFTHPKRTDRGTP